MVETPPQIPSSNPTSTTNKASRSTTRSRRKVRFPVEDDEDEEDSGEIVIECSKKHCSSCTAHIVADCIAMCCCPCAIINLLVLAFVKVPWIMGRKCLRFLRKKRKKLDGKRLKISSTSSIGVKDEVIERESGNLRRERVRVVVGDEKIMELPSDFVEKDDKFCPRFEAERVWLELYQLGHLGFGRVSFSGSLGKGN